MSIQKIVIVGDKNIDKISFKNKFLKLQDDEIKNNRFLSWNVNQQQLKIEFKIVEENELSAVKNSFFRSANGFICIFDTNDENSLSNIKKMHEEILDVRSQTRMILVGLKNNNYNNDNNNDKKSLKKVPKRDAKKLAKSWKAEYFEINNENIDKENIENCLNVLMKAIIENKHTRLVSGRKSIKKTLDRFKYYNCFQ